MLHRDPGKHKLQAEHFVILCYGSIFVQSDWPLDAQVAFSNASSHAHTHAHTHLNITPHMFLNRSVQKALAIKASL